MDIWVCCSVLNFSCNNEVRVGFAEDMICDAITRKKATHAAAAEFGVGNVDLSKKL